MEARCLVRASHFNRLHTSILLPQRTSSSSAQCIRSASSIAHSTRAMTTSSTSNSPAQAEAIAPEDAASPPPPPPSSPSSAQTFSRPSFLRFAPSGGQKSGGSDTNNIQTLNHVSSILDNLMTTQQPRQRTPRAASPNAINSVLANISNYRDQQMSPSQGPDPNSVMQNVQRALGGRHEPLRPKPKVDLRLTPSLGRTVAVDTRHGMDVNRAFRMMESQCARNRVRVQERNQKFHVRRGQLRKQVRVDRWKKLFKFSFQHTVQRCEKLRAQGW
ncbi:hypothetical protein AJ80_08513 [Polytolypa hystricis UAMH7299]|uniref:Ribosomal protein S21 n=1 Tax=Polytolypa hystricis (strain UAMH7299) TaxID=1447883 RepID=A0A2B7X6G4_POLH7|nr:hypothetical protein AJ80_08513 [Polytolypa hystricis UAMH7299]